MNQQSDNRILQAIQKTIIQMQINKNKDCLVNKNNDCLVLDQYMEIACLENFPSLWESKS